MAITIHLPAPYKEFAGNSETVSVNGNTVGECLRDMFQKCPDLQNAVPPTGFEILLNGRSVFSWGSDRPVKDGDELTITPVSGCC